MLTADERMDVVSMLLLFGGKVKQCHPPWVTATFFCRTSLAADYLAPLLNLNPDHFAPKATGSQLDRTTEDHTEPPLLFFQDGHNASRIWESSSSNSSRHNTNPLLHLSQPWFESTAFRNETREPSGAKPDK